MPRGLIALTLLALLALFAPVPAHAAGVIYVDDSATGAANGASWADAYPSLQAALDAADAGDAIWVAEGVYRPAVRTNASDPRSASFVLEADVALYGGFAGRETALDQRRWADHPAILSGEIGGPASGDNAYHVVIANRVEGGILDGFTITGGNANGAAPVKGGGGVLIQARNPTLQNLILIGNQADDVGGAIYLVSGQAELRNVRFEGNRAGSGGALHILFGQPSITNATFANNQAGASGGAISVALGGVTLTDVLIRDNQATMRGGGLSSVQSSLSLSGVTFSGNSAPDGGAVFLTAQSRGRFAAVSFTRNSATSGGAIYNLASSPFLEEVTFSENTASEGGAIFNRDASAPALDRGSFSGNTATYGGAIFNRDGSSPRLARVIFEANRASEFGGAIFNRDGSSPQIANTVFQRNSATLGGGGMLNDSGSSPTLANTLFSGNATDGSGGAIFSLSASNPTLTHVTLSGNSARGFGGAIVSIGANLTLHNSIVWGNTASNNPQISSSGGTLTIRASDVQGGATCPPTGVCGNLDADPAFVRAPTPGPDGVWGSADDDPGDLHLQPGSPAIAAGDVTLLAADSLDLDGDNDRGEPLPVDLDDRPRQAGEPDMGAYEGLNQPPLANAGGPYAVPEGSSITLDGSTSSDPEADSLSYAWDLDYDGAAFDPDATGPHPTFDATGLDGPLLVVVALQVTDSHDAVSAITTAQVQISNVAPTVAPVAPSSDPVASGASVAVSAAFSDPGAADLHSATWDWGDGTTDTLPVSAGDRLASASHSYSQPGRYTIALSLADDDGAAGAAEGLVTVYDPNAGVVEGNGAIVSPPGACQFTPACQSARGRIFFNLKSRYQRGANQPSGWARVTFQAANLSFRSQSQHWLLTDGARAQLSGHGQINGAGDYAFLLSMIDGGSQGTSDRLRITIWNRTTGAPIYDSQPGADVQAAPTAPLSTGGISVQAH